MSFSALFLILFTPEVQNPANPANDWVSQLSFSCSEVSSGGDGRSDNLKNQWAVRDIGDNIENHSYQITFRVAFNTKRMKRNILSISRTRIEQTYSNLQQGLSEIKI